MVWLWYCYLKQQYSNSLPWKSSWPNKVAGLWDNPCKGLPDTKGQSLVDLDFLGICCFYFLIFQWLYHQKYVMLRSLQAVIFVVSILVKNNLSLTVSELTSWTTYIKMIQSCTAIIIASILAQTQTSKGTNSTSSSPFHFPSFGEFFKASKFDI